MIWYDKWLSNFMIIIHQLLIAVYMPALHYTSLHIIFTYTVTRLTSTLIKSGKSYKKDYHEIKKKKKTTHVSPSAQLLHVHNILVYMGYEPADLTVHPPPKRSRVGSFFCIGV